MQRSKENMKQTIHKCINRIKNDTVSLSIVLLVVAIAGFMVMIFVKRIDPSNFIEGVQIELFGIIFDIALLVLFFNWVNKKGEKNRRIESYLNEIEDFRTWHSEEAKYRIIGNIKRLNREGHTKISLRDCWFSGSNIPGGETDLRNIDLTGSSLLQAEFEYCNLFDAKFNGAICHGTKFSYSGANKIKFISAHLQGVKFTEAELMNADFSHATITGSTDFSQADLRSVKFTDTTFGSAQFHMAIVSESFVEDLKNWKINGTRIFDDYLFVKAPIEGRAGMYRYYLFEKDGLTPYMTTEHIDLKDAY